MSRHSSWLKGVLLLCVLYMLLPTMPAFNFMPRASFVIRAPQDQQLNLPQVRSSYFGYTLVMRETR